MPVLKRLSEFQLGMILREWARNHDVPKERVQEFVSDVMIYINSKANDIKK